MREIWALKRLKNLSTELTCEIVSPEMESFFYKFIYSLKRCFFCFLNYFSDFSISVKGFVYFYFLHHRFQIKSRARLYQFLDKKANYLLKEPTHTSKHLCFQNQRRTNCLEISGLGKYPFKWSYWANLAYISDQ